MCMYAMLAVVMQWLLLSDVGGVIVSDEMAMIVSEPINRQTAIHFVSSLQLYKYFPVLGLTVVTSLKHQSSHGVGQCARRLEFSYKQIFLIRPEFQVKFGSEVHCLHNTV